MGFKRKFYEERALLIKAVYQTLHLGLLNCIPTISNLEHHTWDKQECIKANIFFTKAINMFAEKSYDLQHAKLKECWNLLLEVNDSLNIIRKNANSKQEDCSIGYFQHDFINLTNILASTIYLLDEK
jgi:hypothetical protein